MSLERPGSLLLMRVPSSLKKIRGNDLFLRKRHRELVSNAHLKRQLLSHAWLMVEMRRRSASFPKFEAERLEVEGGGVSIE